MSYSRNSMSIVRYETILRIVLLCIVIVMSSCKKEADDQMSASVSNEVTIIMAVNALGDNNINDKIYESISIVKEKYVKDSSVVIHINVPSSMQQAEQMIDYWIKEKTDARRLLVLCNETMGDWLTTHDGWSVKDNSDILVLDSYHEYEGVYNRYINSYGVSYMIGALVYYFGTERDEQIVNTRSKPALICANKQEGHIKDAVAGFVDGFRSLGGELDEEKCIIALSDAPATGYDMSDSVFRLSAILCEEGYDFIFPLCGGSANGVYSYAISKIYFNSSNTFYTCGVDVDVNEVVMNSLISTLRSYDLLLKDFIADWIEQKPLELHSTEFLGSKYCGYAYAGGDYRLTDNLEQVVIESQAAEIEYFEKREQ